MKTWLNTVFYNKAFLLKEKAQIRTSTLITDKANWGGSDIDTTAKVFILSYQDVVNAQYKITDSVRISTSTDYTKDSDGYNYYWLRTTL